MIVPFLLTYLYVIDLNVELWSTWNRIEKVIGIFIPTAIIFSAIGYSVRELFRSTSKLCFQNVLFCEDETKMPTTEFLLWKTHHISDEEKGSIRKKIQEQENYLMLTPEQELADETQARLNIVGAVKLMRQRTWGHNVLTQYNYQYGFWRNLLGGLLWDLLFGVFLLLLNIKYHHIDNIIIVVAIFLE